MAIFVAAGLMAPAACRPTSSPEAGRLVSEANVVVVGRVVSVVWPDGRPQDVDDSTLYKQSVTISVSAVIKGETELPPPIGINVGSYNAVALNAFAVFFLKRRFDGVYSNADVDHWALSAKQFNPVRKTLASDPLEAVSQEMLAVLATPSAQLDDHTSGAMHMGWPDSLPGGFHSMAVWALFDVPAAYVVGPLQHLVASPDQSIRIWAVDSLLRHRDYTGLPAIVPDLIAPPAEALTAAQDLGWKLDADGIPSSLAPTLIKLLASKVPSLRGNAANALGRSASQPAVRPLIDSIERETDIEAMRGEMEGLCRATNTRTPPCDRIGWYGHNVENPALWRRWALAQAYTPIVPLR